MNGPVSLFAMLFPGHSVRIKMVADGRLGAVNVVPPDPGSEAFVRFSFDEGTNWYCLAFGGGAGGDVVGNSATVFQVRDPTARPANCAGSSTTTTTSTTTSTTL